MPSLTRSAEGLDRRAFTVDEINRMTDIGVINDDEYVELIECDIVPGEPL
jgi:hypothetical protein